MATISRSDRAPSGDLHVLLGNVEFDLTSASASYETKDVAVIAAANENVLLKVEADAVKADTTAVAYDANDPHDNPTADHLSALASPEALKAANDNEAAIKSAVGDSGQSSTAGPSAAEVLTAAMKLAAPDATPELPSQEAAPVAEAPPVAPAPPTAPATAAAPSTTGSPS